MSSKAVSGKGTVFSIGTPITTPVYTVIGELKTFSQSGGKNATEDVTNADSAGRATEFITTLLTSGEYSLGGNYVSSDAGQVMLRAAFNSGAVTPFKMVLPLQGTQTTTGETWTFSAVVTELDVTVSYDKATQFTAKLTISGLITIVSGT
jgi:predicted secreted protein